MAQMTPALAGDVEYVERHTTNARILSVCAGLKEAYVRLTALERQVKTAVEQVEQVKAHRLPKLVEDLEAQLALLPPLVISHHCPVCLVRRKTVARATKKWRARKLRKAAAGGAAPSRLET